VKQLGIGHWQENYFWPLPDDQFFRVADVLFTEYDRAYENLSQGERDIFLSDTEFLAFLSQHVHAVIMESVCRSMNIAIAMGPLASSFYAPIWEELSLRFDPQTLLRGRWKYRLKRVAKHMRFGKGVPWSTRVCNAIRHLDAWSLGSFSRLKAEYVRANNILCDHPYAQTLLKMPRGSGRHPLAKRVKEAIRSLVSGVDAFVQQQYGATLALRKLEVCWARRLEDLQSIYLAIREQGDGPKLLLLSESASPIHKAITLGLRRNGTKAVGFHHGNDMGNSWEKNSAYVESAHCDDFVCPTQRAALFHQREYEKSGISRFHSVRFISGETPFYANLFARSARKAFPQVTRKVMIIGYPLNANRYLYSNGDFFVFQLDLELRLVTLLKEQGFEIIYKMHPDRQKEAGGLFSGKADRILVEPFETVYEEADAIIFGCTTSTTFGFALCLNKPVFVFDLEGKYWNPEAYELLRKRCVMIPTRFDERNRLQFEAGWLVDKLKQRPEIPDFAYVEQVMFPQGFSTQCEHQNN
jgi:hypothetical protein